MVAPDPEVRALIGTTGNQWARITVPSNDVMLQSMVEPATGEATTEVVGTGRSQASVVAALAVVVVGDAEDDEHPANDPATTTAGTNATQTVRKWARRLRDGRSGMEGRIGGVLHWLPPGAILVRLRARRFRFDG